MFMFSPASRCDVSTPGDNARSNAGISNPRFGAGYRVRAETAPVQMECDQQKRNVRPAEPVAQQEVPKKKFALMSAANINRPYPRATEESTGAVKMASCESMVTEEVSHGASVYGAGDDTPNHDACNELTWPGHTDACWNDPRWNDRNRELRAIVEQQIQSGLYHDRPDKKYTIMSRDQRFKTELSSFTYREHSCYGYSNIRVTKCEDATILANINSFDPPFLFSFQWNGHQCLLSGRNAVTPVVVNLDTGKAYEQRGDQYNAFELEWYAVEASPDGKTFLAKGALSAGWEDEYRFYDASKPEQGFRCLLPGGLSIIGIPDNRDATTPEWGEDQDGRTIVSLTVRKGHDKDKSVDENGDLAVFKTIFRREEDRMAVVASEAIPLRTDSSSSDEDSDSQLSGNDDLYA